MSTNLQSKPTPLPIRSAVRSREIVDADVDTLAKFLGAGLGYPSCFYSQVLDRLKQHPTPTGFPRYGFVLESDGKIVGAVLMIFSTIWSDDHPSTRCHVTSWYVEPGYRHFATLFFSRALKYPDVTYINISARPSTRSIIRAQGFLQYSQGQFVSVPSLNFFSKAKDKRVEIVAGDQDPIAPFEAHELDLLRAHSRYGCISLWCRTPERAFPFVFHKRLFKGLLPGVQLVFSRDIQDFVRFVAPLGLYLATRGSFVVSIDSNGPIPGLVGKYFDGVEPRYYKGARPRLGDLSYTQAVMSPSFRRGASGS